MLKTREVLRLRHELGLSLREIGQACNCGKTTVSEILMRAKSAEIVWSSDLNRIIGTDTYFLEVKIIKKTISFGEHEF